MEGHFNLLQGLITPITASENEQEGVREAAQAGAFGDGDGETDQFSYEGSL